MTRVAANMPGYASVAQASDVLHLARRSVRGLIYAGRLPSVRLGRLHFIKSADLESERRRRLGLPLPSRAPRLPRSHAASTSSASDRSDLPGSSVLAAAAADSASTRSDPDVPPTRAESPAASRRVHPHADSALRCQRAAERAELVRTWTQRHHIPEPHVPALVLGVTTPVTCEVCGREVRGGRMVELAVSDTAPAARLCTTCGRRALLDWADRRRQEAAAARRLSESLGQPGATPSESRVA